MLGEDGAKSDSELRALAIDGLRAARKTQNYRSEVVFASLVKFYEWKPRVDRVKAALRCAKAIGREPAFARVLLGQARHFKACGFLKPFRQGQRSQGTLVLADEAFTLGLQRWLRTLEIGKVRVDVLHMGAR